MDFLVVLGAIKMINLFLFLSFSLSLLLHFHRTIVHWITEYDGEMIVERELAQSNRFIVHCGLWMIAAFIKLDSYISRH